MVSKDPDHHTRDLFEAIERGDYPSWNVYVQVMDPKDAENYRWNIFDMTRVWPHKDYPLRRIGKMTLNENVRFNMDTRCDAECICTAQKLLRGHRASGLFTIDYGARYRSISGS